jgi:site-specific DNA-methyltransferase (adenine-specific)
MIPSNNKIICGDVLDVLRTFDDCIFDLIITSPPYNLGGDFHTGWRTKDGYKSIRYGAYDTHGDNMPEDEYQNWQIEVMNELYRVVKDDGNFFYNHKNRIKDFKIISPYEWILKTKWTLRQEIIWDTTNEVNQDARRFIPCHEQIYWFSKNKTHIDNTGERLNDCWIFRNKLKRKDTGHPATFPIELIIRLLSVLPSAKLVLDPFMGSGTTALACIDLNRDYVGIEVSPAYVDITNRRIEEKCAQEVLL